MSEPCKSGFGICRASRISEFGQTVHAPDVSGQQPPNQLKVNDPTLTSIQHRMQRFAHIATRFFRAVSPHRNGSTGSKIERHRSAAIQRFGSIICPELTGFCGISVCFVQLAIEGGAANFQPPRDLRHLAAVM